MQKGILSLFFRKFSFLLSNPKISRRRRSLDSLWSSRTTERFIFVLFALSSRWVYYCWLKGPIHLPRKNLNDDLMHTEASFFGNPFFIQSFRVIPSISFNLKAFHFYILSKYLLAILFESPKIFENHEKMNLPISSTSLLKISSKCPPKLFTGVEITQFA